MFPSHSQIVAYLSSGKKRRKREGGNIVHLPSPHYLPVPSLICVIPLWTHTWTFPDLHYPCVFSLTCMASSVHPCIPFLICMSSLDLCCLPPCVPSPMQAALPCAILGSYKTSYTLSGSPRQPSWHVWPICTPPQLSTKKFNGEVGSYSCYFFACLWSFR